ncbi:unnamed protein product [Rotaria socialis]|uniref:Thioredoxin domain-containing protein n=1 Tax=Rotaria socialis TaxID=392032 RepID=A0A820T5U4_9BILA|nr:unnamed protein product [Rotaria socialis]CAF4463510.1 unnamed protein product [Rotaria socialis]CAF4696020.1 unnamed protein product [Rotaria socialis]
MFDRSLLLLLLLPCLISTQLVDLTDKTWREMLTGQWMVEFYAPWCPACQQFKQIWRDFSNAMSSRNIKVGAVDVDKYQSLSGRFRISSLPTILHVRDGVFHQYEGERSLRGLRNYIDKEEWLKSGPMSSSFAPDSLVMSLISYVFDLSLLVKNAYSILLDQYGWPAWLIYTVFGIAMVIVGIIIGFDESDAEYLEDAEQNPIGEDESDTTKDELNTPDDVEGAIEEDINQPTTATDQTVRQRRLKD